MQKKRLSRQAVVRTASVPAPVGGLNLRDAVAEMDATDAVILDNFFPDRTSVRLRNGYTKWATGFAAAVESLMVYSSGTGRKLFAASGTAFYDASLTGAIGAAVVTGLTNARWEYTNIGTPGGQFLLAANGVDSIRRYDGTTWLTIIGTGTGAITGVTTSLLQAPHLFKNRVWFVEKNSFRMWYLPIQSIAGAAVVFDLSTVFKLGGYLVSMTSWTYDSAADIDNYACFTSSEGEVVIYKGTDPASADTFALVGVFRVGRTVGPRGFVKIGADLIAVTADGFFPFSQGIVGDRSNQNKALSDKINKGVTADFNTYSGSFGWDIKLHPAGSKVIVNVPAAPSRQYVMNTNTGAWCRYTGWNANCFELFGDQLMFGGSNYVAWCDQGNIDDAVAINGDVLPAFGYFGTKLTKQFTMIRPIIQSGGKLNLSISMNYDFQPKNPTSTPALSMTSGSPWNSSPWNTSPWGAALSLRSGWIGVTGTGFAASPRIQCSVIGQDVIWQSTDFALQTGGVF